MVGPGDQKTSRPNPHRPLQHDIDTYLLRLSGEESGGSVSLMCNTLTYKTKNLSILDDSIEEREKEKKTRRPVIPFYTTQPVSSETDRTQTWKVKKKK